MSPPRADTERRNSSAIFRLLRLPVAFTCSNHETVTHTRSWDAGTPVCGSSLCRSQRIVRSSWLGSRADIRSPPKALWRVHGFPAFRATLVLPFMTRVSVWVRVSWRGARALKRGGGKNFKIQRTVCTVYCNISFISFGSINKQLSHWPIRDWGNI